VHLKGVSVLACRPREMVKGNWGRNVNLSSVSAWHRARRTTTAKAGLQGMAKTLAIELGRYGVTVNAVARLYRHRDDPGSRSGLAATPRSGRTRSPSRSRCAAPGCRATLPT
jgi:NAD(P)-dependent dehydrogenase (short-subunit alcohol dehydrogenase family)